ncbi:MAG: carbohydrate-binding domain-containing protein [Candidatus Omnitrophica bacterium]|nr:carbohydrate-binding domain-containing protein [Candidatus Omnitrophota bacterium]
MRLVVKLKICFNIINIFLFASLCIIISTPFIAKLYAEKAQAFEANYRWGNADKMYKRAIALDRFNAIYINKYGSFLSKRARCQKEQLAGLEQSLHMHKRALALSSKNAEYWYHSGKDILDIYKQSRAIGTKKQSLDSAIYFFKQAIKYDPWNFQNNYLIGWNLLKIYNDIGAAGQEFAMDCLKRALEIRPGKGPQYIYPMVMHYTRNFDIIIRITPNSLSGYNNLYSYIKKYNLWQYRKRVIDKLEYYHEKEDLKSFIENAQIRNKKMENISKAYNSWQGVADNSKNEYKDGNMYWSGAAHLAVDIPNTPSNITIKARGSKAKDIWPYMIVELDGEAIGENFVNSKDWTEYTYEVKGSKGVKVLSVTFPNDYCNTINGVREDRNLYIGGVRVESIIESDREGQD